MIPYEYTGSTHAYVIENEDVELKEHLSGAPAPPSMMNTGLKPPVLPQIYVS
jgi:hypothetical protein